MEELKRRLEFNNASVQVQAVWKLYETIIKKREKSYDGTINNSTPAIAELCVLLDKCADSGNGVVLSCCSQALVELVRNGVADWTYMLNCLLNLVPSSSNLSGIVSGLGELMVLQATVKLDSGQPYQCPYTIRLPTHPFITVITNRPADSWPHLQQQVLTICCAHDNEKVQQVAVKIVEPFLSFVLLEPEQRSVYEAARNGLQRTLLGICHDGVPATAHAVVDYLLQILPSLQISSITSLSNVCSLIYELCALFVSSNSKQFSLNQTSSLLDYGLSVILHCQSSHAPDVSFLGEKLLALIQQYPKCVSDLTLVCLADILHSLAPGQATTFLKMVFSILNDSETFYLPHLTGMLVPGLLVVMATPLPPSRSQRALSDHNMALAVLKLVEERVFSSYSDPKILECKQRQAIKSSAYEHHLYINLSQLFTKNPEQSHDWLLAVTSSVSHLCNISLSLMNFISSLLLSCDQVSNVPLILDILVQAASKHSNQAPMLLAVVQYALSRHTNPAIRLIVLTALPRLATHKITVSPVLRFIHALRSSAKLRPKALHLMTLLWKQQPRTFPQLHQMFLQESQALEDVGHPDKDDTAVSLNLLSQAQAAWAILGGKIEAVHSHGGDMLLPMSTILNVAASERSAPAVALVIRCLAILCQQEVIDIQSTWQQIGAKFLQDKRCAVLKELCGLIAVIPQLGINTEQHQEFEAYAASILWKFAFDGTEGVRSAAFSSLKHFLPNHFQISHLPEQITRDIIEQALTKLKSTCNIDEIEPAELEPDKLVPDVPSVCYARLFTYIQPHARKGYGEFLQKNVRDEALNMPRGIQFMAQTRRHPTANQNKAVKNIPSFLQGQYEKTAQPGVRPGYIAGLLFCYELSEPELGRNGQPRPNDMLMRGRNYQEMFTRLLRECPIWPDDTQYCLAVCDAWASFMERAFTSILQGRQTELDMQWRHGQISEDEVLRKKSTLWMIIRDRLTDMIKAASKNSPGQQVNAVIALAGLAAAVARHVTAMEAVSTGHVSEEYQGQNHPRWIIVIMNTVMSLMDITYMPTGPLLGLCQQRSGDDRIPPSSLCQAAACLAASHLAPVCMTVDMDRVFDMLSLFRARLNEALTDTSGDATLKLRREFLSLGLSLTISRLVQERFSDTAGTKGMLEIWKGIHLLEDRAFDQNTSHQAVCMLSLGPLLVSLCTDGQTDSRVHVQATQQKMLDMFEATQPTSTVYQPLCLTLAQLTSAGVTSNALQLDQAHSLLDRLYQVKDHCSHAFAMLSYCLSSISGGSAVLNLQHEVIATWSRQIHSDTLSSKERFCLLSAIMTLAGIGRRHYTATQGTELRAADVHLIEVVKIATILARSSDNLDLQHQACWQLGQLYHVSTASVTSSASVPLDYSYLPQPSFLQGVVAFLQQASQEGPDSISSECVQLALEALTVDVTRSLPPLNWAAVLSPLIRLGYGVAVNRLCLQLAVKQSCTSPTAATFISAWLVDPLFSTLPAECQDDLYKALQYFVKCQPVSRLTEFLHQGCIMPFKSTPVSEQHCVSVLAGLRQALLMDEPPEAVVSLLYQFTETVYKLLTADAQPHLLCDMAECLCQLPDAVFDKVTATDFSQTEGIMAAAGADTMRGLYIRCYAVANGKQQMTLLSEAIDAVLNSTDCDMDEVMYLLCSCCYQCCYSDSTLLGKMPRLQWLLEYLGHVNNMAAEVSSLEVTDRMVKRLEFAVCSICAILALWSSPGIGGLIGLVPDYFSCSKWPTSSSDVPHSSTRSKTTKLDCVEVAGILKICANNVSADEPWKQLLIKVIDWMYTMRQLPGSHLRSEVKQILADCSVAMRSAPELCTNFYWVKAITPIA